MRSRRAPCRLVAFALAVLGPELAHASGAPHVPEPMELDLVRGLAPDAGELEANVLATLPMRIERDGIEWAAEIEWAPLRDVALELEVPFSGYRVDAVKLVAQATLGRSRRDRVAHGLQLAVALPLRADPSMQAVHVVCMRFGRRGGLVTLAGARISLPTVRRAPEAGAVVATSVFASLPADRAVGVEASFVGGRHDGRLSILPQIHLPLGRYARAQFGVGVHHALAPSGWEAVAAVRVIVERRSKPATTTAG
jgi:hypothetical protein